jgi:hypothetical protein
MPQTRQLEFNIERRTVELDAHPQPVVVYAHDLNDGEGFPPPTHRRAQLIYASHGVMEVTTLSAAYVVPPQRALWMPGEVEHRIEAHSGVAMRTL